MLLSQAFYRKLDDRYAIDAHLRRARGVPLSYPSICVTPDSSD